MIADGRSPDIVAVLYAFVEVEVGAFVLWQHGVVVFQRGAYNLPVDEVGGVEDLQAGKQANDEAVI